jgi:protocatechuate 3,4-dioxygenase beta subunit
MRSTWEGDYRNQNRYVFADDEGRFTISTGHLGGVDEPPGLSAYSSEHGLARVDIKGLASGEQRNVTLQLGGAVDIKGRITDPEGQPIRDMVCLTEYNYSIWNSTDANGQFYLGRVALPVRGGPSFRVEFRAPRPQRGELCNWMYPFDSALYAVDQRETAPKFFTHKNVELEPQSAEQINLNVVLQPAKLLEITGTVIDPEGKAVQGAKVYLLTGDANEASWLEVVDPQPTGNIKRIMGTKLAGTLADENGRWRFWTVQETGPVYMGSRDTDWTKYCIGVQGPDGLNRLVRDIVVPEDEDRRQLRTVLGK